MHVNCHMECKKKQSHNSYNPSRTLFDNLLDLKFISRMNKTGFIKPSVMWRFVKHIFIAFFPSTTRCESLSKCHFKLNKIEFPTINSKIKFNSHNILQKIREPPETCSRYTHDKVFEITVYENKNKIYVCMSTSVSTLITKLPWYNHRVTAH